MFRFLYPNLLFLLIPVALLALFALYRIIRMRKTLKRFGDTHLVRDLMPDLSLRRKVYKDIMIIGALMLGVLALARPQMGAKPEKTKRQGIELIVAMDISNSMLADDIKPSRLSVAKSIVSKLVDNLEENRVGLILFAGDAFVQLPITSDFISAKMFLTSATPALIESQGTAVGKALTLALRSFSSDETIKRSIVLITDGENHDDDTSEAISQAKDKGIVVHVIGVGSEEGAPIKLPETGDYLLDEEGKMVITKVNKALGEELAKASDGIYVHANDVSTTTKVIVKELDKLDKSELEGYSYSEYNEVFYYFLIPAMLLLLLDALYLDRKNRWIKGIKLFN